MEKYIYGESVEGKTLRCKLNYSEKNIILQLQRKHNSFWWPWINVWNFIEIQFDLSSEEMWQGMNPRHTNYTGGGEFEIWWIKTFDLEKRIQQLFDDYNHALEYKIRSKTVIEKMISGII